MADPGGGLDDLGLPERQPRRSGHGHQHQVRQSRSMAVLLAEPDRPTGPAGTRPPIRSAAPSRVCLAQTILQDNGSDNLTVNGQRRVHLTDHTDRQARPTTSQYRPARRVRPAQWPAERAPSGLRTSPTSQSPAPRRPPIRSAGRSRAFLARWCCRTTAAITSPSRAIGGFTFATGLTTGSPYNVTVQGQPGRPDLLSGQRVGHGRVRGHYQRRRHLHRGGHLFGGRDGLGSVRHGGAAGQRRR